MRNFLLSIIGLCVSLALGAQIPGQRPGTFGPTNGRPAPGTPEIDSLQEEVAKDTFGIYQFFAGNPFYETAYADSSLNQYVHQYDPARRRTWDYMTLGLAGSPAQAIVYEPILRRGFDIGMRQYDLYTKDAGQVPIYRMQTAFTNVEYAQLGDQNNGFFGAQFASNFGKGFTLSLDFNRQNQNSTTTLFQRQRLRSNTLGLGMWFKSQNQRYNGYLTLVNNKFERQENGGVRDSIFTGEGQFSTPQNARIFLSGARSRYQMQEARFTQYFQLNRFGKSDSLSTDTIAVKGKQVYQVAHSISLQNVLSRYSDVELSGLGGFYVPFQKDSRGIRHFLDYQKIENQFRILTFQSQGPLVGRVREEGGLLEVGLVHALHRIQQEPRDSTLNEVFLQGKWRLSPVPLLDLNLSAQFNILGNIGDYQLMGEMDFKLGKLGVLKGKAVNQLYSPNLMQREFWVTQQPVWRNDFRKTLETNLQASLVLDRWGLSLGAGFNLFNNPIYFDTSGLVKQTNRAVSIIQFWIQKNFVFWRLHLDNQLALQSSSDDIIRLPGIFGKHSLYFQGTLFKVLKSRIGFDLRYQSEYYADYYFPLTGQFQLQDTRIVDFYPAIDAFGAFQVTKFRAFVKWENLSQLIFGEQLFFQSSYYPVPPSNGFRIGIKWFFAD